MKKLARLGVLFVCLGSLSCASSPRLPGWTFLGERTVNHTIDRDEIRVGARDGSFRQIKLAVRRRSLTFRDVKVHYANGGVQDVSVRRSIEPGGETRSIDLSGQDRVIDKVVFFYNTQRRRGKRGIVQLYGRP